ncbi:hypothetical protein TNCV_2985601 [Trichonephila clavipes]|nr:hypothetical protein TNCV_2985601 [Trichonephila clavipes]
MDYRLNVSCVTNSADLSSFRGLGAKDLQAPWPWQIEVYSPTGIVVSDTDCGAVENRLEARRRNVCLQMYSAFAAFRYFKKASSRMSSCEVAGRERQYSHSSGTEGTQNEPSFLQSQHSHNTENLLVQKRKDYPVPSTWAPTPKRPMDKPVLVTKSSYVEPSVTVSNKIQIIPYNFVTGINKAVDSLVVRASDSKSEGLGSMPNATKYHPSTHEFHAKIVDVAIGGVAIYRPFGEFRRANSYCHLYGAQGLGQRQAYF